MRLKTTITAILTMTSSLFAEQPEVVKLTPPLINSKTIECEICGTRPVRNGGFNISLEYNANKTIVNCYGHGGAGWTTLFGSVHHAIELFENEHPSKKTPIRVIGCGCVGLTTAIELARLGYYVEGITAKDVYDTASWYAGGSFSWGMSQLKPQEKILHAEMKRKTFLTYQQIEQGKHTYLNKNSVRFIPSYSSKDSNAGLADLVAQGLVPPGKPVTLDFGNGVIHKDYVQYMTYFMNVSYMMKQLMEEVHKLEIPIEIKEIRSFADLSESIVFNCTGLGSRELTNDRQMVAYRGHLIMLNEAAGKGHMDYMIDTSIIQEGHAEDVYMFPKDMLITDEHRAGIRCAGVLGGTYIAYSDKLSKEELRKLDQQQFKLLQDRLSLFFTGHAFSE